VHEVAVLWVSDRVDEGLALFFPLLLENPEIDQDSGAGLLDAHPDRFSGGVDLALGFVELPKSGKIGLPRGREGARADEQSEKRYARD
jgi:hypothetical protein